MNERIRQLAEQAGSTHKQNLGVYQFYSFELEEFAKIIILESLSVVKDLHGYSGVGIDGNPYDTESWNAALKAVSRQIKQHFGVEE